MYESPINVSTSNIMESIVKEVHEAKETAVLSAVCRLGIDVNKDELIKALKYDRHQYEKGYEDGKADSVIRAHWEVDEYGDGICSHCHMMESYQTDYCPNCGACMNEEDKI